MNHIQGSKTIILAVLFIFLINTGASSLSHNKHRRIIRKAVRTHQKLERNKKWKTIGRSNRNNKILCREFGKGKKTVLIIGGMHGDEPGSVLAVIKFAKYLEKNPGSIKHRVVIIPCLNPDGLRVGRRTNGKKIDLNRNFPSKNWSFDYEKKYNNPGPLPASEPEIIIAINAMDRYLPWLIIQVHQPFAALYPDNGPPADLLSKMSEISGFPVSDDIGYSTPGSLGSFITDQEYKVSGITYELGRVDREPDYKAITRSLIEAVNYP
ncbi:MAG TPA: DUF2817 domain-containing protein [Spirochaetota bacterium]|nr:DUF2817 domain-containing protein [Spirochaetota bacterium]